MLRKTYWALALVFIVTQGALSQDGEKLPPPAKLPATLNGPAPESMGPISFEGTRPPVWVYADADYLLWWVNHNPAPILLTTAPNNGLNVNGLTGGILGEPGTIVRFTGRDLGYPSFSGFRARAGVHLGPDGFWSLEGAGFLLPRRSIDASFSGRGDGSPLLTTPFLDAATGSPSSLDINSQDAAFNPYLLGSIAFHSDIVIYGYEFNAVAHSIRTAERSFDLMFGFRAVYLQENLQINQTITPVKDANLTVQFPEAGLGVKNYFDVLAGSPVLIRDRFGTRNAFYGPQIGCRFSWTFDRFSADLTGKVAVGVTHQQASIDGSTSTALARDPNTLAVVTNLTTPGGVFALRTNSGNFNQNQFTVVPEIGLNLKYAITHFLHLHVGYSGLYWSNVARPGAQIDTVINQKLVPTGALLPTNTNPTGAFIPGSEQGRPSFAFRDTAFWAHGLNFGVELRY
jgi:hypothetical protein